MMSVSRRTFLRNTSAVLVGGMMAQGKVFGANERIGVCTIGCNGQGNSHINDLLARGSQAEYVAICDVDQRVLDLRARTIEKKQGKKISRYQDIHDVMADKDIDAITIATPNHWHTLAAIWGCQAGKDVYVEKPLSHGVWEGRQLVAAAKKYNRIVQHGTQSRSDHTLLRDIKLIHEGFIGKVMHSRGYVYKNGNRHAIGHGAPGTPPEALDWTLWQGPAQEAQFLKNVDDPKRTGLYVHYNWHWFWEYGNGEIGNQGVHEMDIACWGHDRGMPVKVASTGGRFGWDDDGETPNTQATQFTYDDGSMMTFEVRNLGSFHEADGGACGNSFFGSDGYYVRSKGFFDYKNNPIKVDEPKPENIHKFDRFLKAVRDRDNSVNPCNAEVGHVSCVNCHIGNISYRLGDTLKFDPKTEQFVGNDAANAQLKRTYRDGYEVPQLA